MDHLNICILAGGVGSRFWPASTASRPKQFLDITNSGRSLLQQTYDRFINMGCQPDHIFVITNMDYVRLVHDQLPSLSTDHILGEPQRKNTAPAAYAATKWIEAHAGDTPILFVPSDHLIKDEPAYQATLERGRSYIQDHDVLITIGIRPDHPHTGYGYIEVDMEGDVVPVASFREKPDRATAERYVAGGRHLWNAGMFLWRPSTILEEFDRHGASVVEAFAEVQYDQGHEVLIAGLQTAFDRVIDESLDYLIMERSDRLYTLPAAFGWSDLGSWTALYDEMVSTESDQVVVAEDSLSEQSDGCMIYAPGKKVVVSGLKDYLILVDGDIVVVCPKSDDQRIKQYRSALQNET